MLTDHIVKGHLAMSCIVFLPVQVRERCRSHLEPEHQESREGSGRSRWNLGHLGQHAADGREPHQVGGVGGVGECGRGRVDSSKAQTELLLLLLSAVLGSSQGRDMRLCVWDVSQGRSQVVDSLWTGSVGFCQGSLLQSRSGSFLLAFPGEQTEEVRQEAGDTVLPLCSGVASFFMHSHIVSTHVSLMISQYTFIQL